MKRYSGISHCEQHGDFEWKTFYLESGEYKNYKCEDVMKNCIDRNVDPVTKVCTATVRCPVCGRRFHATDPA